MKRLIPLSLVIALLLPAAAFAAGLDVFISNVNVQARADLPGFSVGLSTQFGVPVTQVQAVIRSVPEPADAFMILQLGQMSHRSPDAVMSVYRSDKKRGWGVIAKDLGIKPGSAEFHALKNGDLHYTGHGGGGGKSGGGHGGHGGHGAKGGRQIDAAFDLAGGHGGGHGNGGGHGRGRND